MRIIAGLLKADSGQILIDGMDIGSRHKEMIGYMPDFFGVYDKLRVKEYMAFFASIYSLDREKTEQKTAKLFETAICGSLILAKTNKNASEFAKNFGIAFQIRDDIINIKTSKTDIKDGIYTAPIIYAGNTENYTNGIEKSQILLNNYIENAYQAIKHIEENKYKIAIIELLGLLKNE